MLQNTNVVLLEKEGMFRRDADFSDWAMQIAYLEVQRYRASHVQAQRRFNDALLDQLAAHMPKSAC